jgi:hypothetical protein
VVFAALVTGSVYNHATGRFGIRADTIAAAAVAAALAWWAMRQIERRAGGNADVNVTPNKSKHWFRFSLKALLVLMTAVAAWLGYWKSFQDRRAAVAAIERLGGTLDAKYHGPKWLSIVVGDERYFWEPTGVHFKRPLKLAELESVLPSLMSFQHLHVLNFQGTTITDGTLPIISPLASKLTLLNLHGSPISDASIEHLKPFQRLVILVLSDTNLTSAGLAELHDALPACTISAFVRGQIVSLGPE